MRAATDPGSQQQAAVPAQRERMRTMALSDEDLVEVREAAARALTGDPMQPPAPLRPVTPAAAEPIVPIEAEPRHELKFQNRHLRLFDVQLPPGYATLVHTHLHDGVFVNVDASETSARGSSSKSIRQLTVRSGRWKVAAGRHAPTVHKGTAQSSSIRARKDPDSTRLNPVRPVAGAMIRS